MSLTLTTLAASFRALARLAARRIARMTSSPGLGATPP
jgi:hypothetical protein